MRDEGIAALAPQKELAFRHITSSIKEVVLLCGSVRADRFHTPMGRSVVSLPIDNHRMLLDQWAEQVRALSDALDREPIPVRTVSDHVSPLPAPPGPGSGVPFTIQRDPNDYRGTGGVLKDLAEAHYDDDEYILVANGAQLVIGSLADHVSAMARRGGDVVVAGHRDGTPSGLMLVRAAALRAVPATGFRDMKEQALPLIARRHDVRVAEFDPPTAQPVRTLPDYMTALRIHHRQQADRPIDHNAFAENLASTFKVIEPGAKVHAEAQLHDAVVLEGASVEAGAIVVRSVVCPGARVRSGQRVVDRMVAGPARAPQAGGAER